MASLVRDAPFGQMVRMLTGAHIFTYPEEQSSFVVPRALILHTLKEPGDSEKRPDEAIAGETNAAHQEGQSDNENIVDWYSPKDPENPKNWSTLKKCFAFAQICLYTFSGQYVGSMKQFLRGAE